MEAQRVNIRAHSSTEESKLRRREQNRLAQRRHREKLKREEQLKNQCNENSKSSSDSEFSDVTLSHLVSDVNYGDFGIDLNSNLENSFPILTESESEIDFSSIPLDFSSTPLNFDFSAGEENSSPESKTNFDNSQVVLFNGNSAPSSPFNSSPTCIGIHDPTSAPSDIAKQRMAKLLSSTKWTFPDEFNLIISMHSMTKALYEIGTIVRTALPAYSSIEDFCEDDALSPLTNFEPDQSFKTIVPTNLHPTLLQRTVPHHPWIDLLPWPEMRDKLIRCQDVFDDNALCEDMKSETGVVVRGNAPWMEMSWEVQEAFAKKYWFLLTPQIIEYSNFWRQQRGETILKFERLKL